MIALLLMVAAPAAACDNQQTQSAMTECAVRRWEQADAALNRQWPVAAAAMKAADTDRDANDKRPGYFAALLASQRAWLQFRDAQCLVEGYQMRGGSGEPMLVAMCKAALTEERVAALKTLSESR